MYCGGSDKRPTKCVERPQENALPLRPSGLSIDASWSSLFSQTPMQIAILHFQIFVLRPWCNKPMMRTVDVIRPFRGILKSVSAVGVRA